MLYGLYIALLVLNVLDYVTTYIVLRYFKAKGPHRGLLPIWKTTRPGQWLRRRRGFRWIKPPKEAMVHYWDHELNPIGVWLMKHAGGIPSLAWFKFTIFLWITPKVAEMMYILPHAPEWLQWFTWIVYSAMDILYVFVVVHNHRIGKKLIRSAKAAHSKGHLIKEKK